jgi:hypothetical protein
VSLRDELLRELGGWGVKVNGDLRDDTSLIVSGRIDSVGLFQLLLWIEEKTGAPSTRGADPRREWTAFTPSRFIERHRAADTREAHDRA